VNHTEHVGVFLRAKDAASGNGDALHLPGWEEADWLKLFRHVRAQPFRPSEVVIQRGATDRVLYFVAAGFLEVGIVQVDGVSLSPLARIQPGSVVGEQSFFDAQPRSANVWAVADGRLLRLEFEEFAQFGDQEPVLARDLLFALGRVLSSRLRNTTARVRR
jgi:CRP/FNR family transcriptional regulator, cyclic AMP receptor protein